MASRREEQLRAFIPARGQPEVVQERPSVAQQIQRYRSEDIWRQRNELLRQGPSAAADNGSSSSSLFAERAYEGSRIAGPQPASWRAEVAPEPMPPGVELAYHRIGLDGTNALAGLRSHTHARPARTADEARRGLLKQARQQLAASSQWMFALSDPGALEETLEARFGSRHSYLGITIDARRFPLPISELTSSCADQSTVSLRDLCLMQILRLSRRSRAARMVDRLAPTTLPQGRSRCSLRDSRGDPLAAIQDELWNYLPHLPTSSKLRVMALAGRMALCPRLTAATMSQLWPAARQPEDEALQEDDWDTETNDQDWPKIRFPDSWGDDRSVESLARMAEVDLSFCRMTQPQLRDLLLEYGGRGDRVNVHTRKLSLAGCELSLSQREEQDEQMSGAPRRLNSHGGADVAPSAPRWAVVPVPFLAAFVHLQYLSLAGCSSVSIQLSTELETDVTIRQYRHTQILNTLHTALPQLLWLDVSGCPIFDRHVLRLLAEGHPEMAHASPSSCYIPSLCVLDARALPGCTVDAPLEHRFYARRVRLLA